MTGWISLHRKIKDHWIFKDAEKLKAWVVILMEVNHSQVKVNIKNKLLIVERGESVKSLETWARLFGKNWDKSKVRRFFNLLENGSMIVSKSERITTRITVCNYDSYQGERNTSETQMKRKRNASETHLTPNNNVNNENNGNNEKKKIKHLTDSDIIEIYSLYPKKLGKAEGFKKLKKEKINLKQIIISKINEYKQATNPNYYKHFSTWVNQKGWEDEYGKVYENTDSINGEDEKKINRLRSSI